MDCVRDAVDRITVKVPQMQFFDVDVVVLGLLCEHAVTSSSSPGMEVETLLESVEVPQLQFIDVFFRGGDRGVPCHRSWILLWR